MSQNLSSAAVVNGALRVKEITICDPLICIIDHPELIVSNVMENSIGPKRMNLQASFC